MLVTHIAIVGTIFAQLPKDILGRIIRFGQALDLAETIRRHRSQARLVCFLAVQEHGWSYIVQSRSGIVMSWRERWREILVLFERKWIEFARTWPWSTTE